MSGYGTKKRGGDIALQLTFPDVASAVVAEMETQPYGYVGRAMFGKASLPVADDLQQRYHAEKSHYANKSAMNGVHNEERSDWLLRHNTYDYTQPRPKLGQRIFANPSLGNQADIYAARYDATEVRGGLLMVIDPTKARVWEGGLEGGVLRTAEGQRYGRNLLKARIGQLNAIEAAAPGVADGPFDATRFPRSPDLPKPPTPEELIELRSILEQIYNTYYENRTEANLPRLVVISLGKYIADAEKLLFKLAVDFGVGDFNAVLRYLENTIRFMRGQLPGGNQRQPPAQDSGVRGQYARMEKMLDYTEKMSKAVNRPRRERILLSNALLKTMGIGVGSGRMRGGEDKPNLPGVPTPPVRPPPPPSGVDFSKGETQGYRVLSAPIMPRVDPELAPEEPEEDEDEVEPSLSRLATKGPFADFPRGAKFTEDQRIRFGDRQGAYYGEEIGERVPVVPVPVPVLPDGEYVHPGSGYVRKAFPKFAVQKKPSNSLKPRRVAPTPKLPMFQETASGIFNEPRLPIPKVTHRPAQTPFTYTGGRAGLPKTVEGFVELAEKLKGSGHSIRVNPTSKLSSIRQNFIRNLML